MNLNYRHILIFSEYSGKSVLYRDLYGEERGNPETPSPPAFDESLYPSMSSFSAKGVIFKCPNCDSRMVRDFVSEWYTCWGCGRRYPRWVLEDR